MTGKTLPSLGALAIIIAAPAAMAQRDIRLDTQVYVERVSTDINGHPRRILANADRVAPGDQIIVVVQWRNLGRRPVRDVAVTRPVARSVELTLSDPAMQVSADGGAHWGRLGQLWLPTPLGGTRRAVASDVTHVRWSLPDTVPPGQAGRLSYRATVR